MSSRRSRSRVTALPLALTAGLCAVGVWAGATLDLVVELGGDRAAPAAFHEDAARWENIEPGDAVACCREPDLGQALAPVPADVVRIRIMEAGKRLVTSRRLPERRTVRAMGGAWGAACRGERFGTTVPLELALREGAFMRSAGDWSTALAHAFGAARLDVLSEGCSTQVVQREGRSDGESVGARTWTARHDGHVGARTDSFSGTEAGACAAAQVARGAAAGAQTSAHVAGRGDHTVRAATTSCAGPPAVKASAGSAAGVALGPACDGAGAKETQCSASGLRPTAANGGMALVQQAAELRTEGAGTKQTQLAERIALAGEIRAGNAAGSATERAAATGVPAQARAAQECIGEEAKYPFRLVLEPDRTDVWPGEELRITATFHNDSPCALRDPEIAVSVPRGLTVVECETGGDVARCEIHDSGGADVVEWSLRRTCAPQDSARVWVVVRCGVERTSCGE